MNEEVWKAAVLYGGCIFKHVYELKVIEKLSEVLSRLEFG
jgi:hypothetical protein